MTETAPDPQQPEAKERSTTRDLLPQRLARIARRVTLGIALVAVVWCLFKFETRWIQPGMNTMDEVPGGSWVLLDRWATGLGVGSDVLVMTPHGEVVSRVSALDDETISIRHPNPTATWPDSGAFGPLQRDQLLGTIVAAFAPERDR